jgi:hypothetical protein
MGHAPLKHTAAELCMKTIARRKSTLFNLKLFNHEKKICCGWFFAHRLVVIYQQPQPANQPAKPVAKTANQGIVNA